MKYWLNLYTWNTWQEFIKAGANVTGFRDRRWRLIQSIKEGDIFLCYMTGISRFFAIQEVTGTPYQDKETRIWNEAQFSSRVPVKPVLALEPEYAVPVISLRENLSFFQDLKSPYAWTGFFRGSPTEINPSDAETILAALQEAKSNPIAQGFDRRKLERKVPQYESERGIVSIPDSDVSDLKVATDSENNVTHEEIQGLLLSLGEEMGMDLWVANDNRRLFKSFKRIRSSLPVQFDAATNKTIELIDVLWLHDNRIVAAFEIEHTTAIYSGLLRMADLITMQPNISIPLFIVAPDERREKVEREINRPIFSKALKQPLPEICRFIPYSTLQEKMEQARDGGFLQYLRPEFLDEIADSVELDNF